MIINGSSRKSISFWSRHLLSTEKNTRAEIKEMRGLGASNLREAMLEMQADATHTRCQNFMYIADFSPTAEELLNEDEWTRAFEVFEQFRGIPEGQSRIVIEHEKEGRTHRHVVWSRIELDKMKAWPDHLDAKTCHEASRAISEELGLYRAPSPYDKDREGDRPPRNPKHWEMFRGMKSGLDPRDITAEVTAIFRESLGAPDFVAGLEEHGYLLVRGDRRNFCILDPAGDVHSLARRLEGVNTKALRGFMSGVEPHHLPTVEQAKQGHRAKILQAHTEELDSVEREIAWQEKLAQAAIAKEKIERQFVEPKTGEESAPDDKKAEEQPELKGMSAKLSKLDKQSDGAKALAAALDKAHIGFAIVTQEEAEKSYREAQFARAIGRFSFSFKEGDIVAVTTPRVEYRRNGEVVGLPNRVHRLDQAFASELVKKLGLEEKLTSIEELKPILDKRKDEAEARWEKIRADNASGKNRPRIHPKRLVNDTFKIATMGAPAIGNSIKLGTKLLGTVADAIDSLLAPTLTPERAAHSEIARSQREAEAQGSLDFDSYLASQANQGRQADIQEQEAKRSERDRDR